MAVLEMGLLPIRLTRTFGAVTLLACSTPAASGDVAAAQVAAATAIAREIATNPGPLETICVAYSGSWEDPPLPSDVDGVAFAYAEGCQEIDGQLLTLAGGRRAIWLGVSEPEPTGSSEALVRIFTSTGSDDLSSYACRLRRDGGSWSVDACELEAIS